MKFTKTSLADAMLIELEPREDPRGYFVRTFCAEEFAAHGLETRFPQANQSHNVARGTLRGMHYQRAPHGEVKVVRCVRGGIHDVIIDLRRDSPSYGRWEGFDLTAGNRRMLYVPKGFAHGLQVLEDGTDVVYQVSHPYTPGVEAGIRWNDPAFAIAWPLPVTVISEKDAAWPDVDLAAGVPI
jgi:dTDP-4-dehydrorhamnose 3,5-epimerase